jgi:hypothetical protein
MLSGLTYKYTVVKILFFWVLQNIFQVYYKSGRQVLTLSNNSQLLLKLAILDKFRLVTRQHLATIQ